jgi:haloalkane dehalogenase
MLQPLGFQQLSIDTSLGKMRYYTATNELWGKHQITPNIDNDRETLLFLHGFGGGSSSYEWSKVYPAFAAEYRVLAPDLIGWGKSAHPQRNYRVEDYLTTIREFIQQTCGETKVTVLSPQHS